MIIGTCLLVITYVVAVNVRLYRSPRIETTFAQLGFLEDALDGGAASRMQAVFPEGYVFSWALYGLAASQLAERLGPSDVRRTPLEAGAIKAVSEISSERARSTFDPGMDPPYGAFYVGWSLYTRSVVLRAFGSAGAAPFDVRRFDVDCDQFSDALLRAKQPYLASYPGRAWPADTAVGVAALAIRDALRGPRHRAAIDRWIGYARGHLDPEVDAISHEVEVETGVTTTQPRGESLALIARLLTDVDPAFARQQYDALRTHYVSYSWGIPGVRVYPNGHDGAGDIDSGPVILGLGGPATVVGAAAALANGDHGAASALLATPDMVGLPIEVGGKRRYALGVLPIGDAFLAWARSTPLRLGANARGYQPLFPWWWRIPFHAVSLLIVRVLARVMFR